MCRREYSLNPLEILTDSVATSGKVSIERNKFTFYSAPSSVAFCLFEITFHAHFQGRQQKYQKQQSKKLEHQASRITNSRSLIDHKVLEQQVPIKV